MGPAAAPAGAARDTLAIAAAIAAARPWRCGRPSRRPSKQQPLKLLGFSGVRPNEDLTPRKTALLTRGIAGNATRTALHWQALEPQRDHYAEGEFARYERLYAALVADDITPIFVLQYAPAWARDSGAPKQCGTSDACHYPPARSELGQWRQFVAVVARRFPKASIEIWNEPNYVGQWQSGVDPERYAQLLAAADQAARSVDPRIPVYAGGLGTAVKDRSLTPPDFLRRAYAARPSLKGHTDALNLHLFPSFHLGPGSVFDRYFKQLRRVRDAAGDHSTPILVSEMGRSTSGQGGLTPSQQADIDLRATRRILSMDDTLGVLVYTLADRNELSSGDPERGFGIGRAGSGGDSTVYHPKPAYCALRHAAGYRGCTPRAGELTRRLKVKVKPKRLRLRAGRRGRKVIVRVEAPGKLVEAAKIQICARGRRHRVKIGPRRCKRAGQLRPGRHVSTSFKVKLRRAGRGKTRIRFIAGGLGVRSGTGKLRIRAR